jgi:hypothetical protein
MEQALPAQIHLEKTVETDQALPELKHQLMMLRTRYALLPSTLPS